MYGTSQLAVVADPLGQSSAGRYADSVGAATNAGFFRSKMTIAVFLYGRHWPLSSVNPKSRAHSTKFYQNSAYTLTVSNARVEMFG